MVQQQRLPSAAAPLAALHQTNPGPTFSVPLSLTLAPAYQSKTPEGKPDTGIWGWDAEPHVPGCGPPATRSLHVEKKNGHQTKKNFLFVYPSSLPPFFIWGPIKEPCEGPLEKAKASLCT